MKLNLDGVPFRKISLEDNESLTMDFNEMKV